MLSDDRRERFACETDCPFVGTTAAILIGAGIAAAGGIGSAAIQSHATGKAVDAQQKATDQATANLAPFQQTGTQAFTTLGALMGLGGPGGGGQEVQKPMVKLGGNTPWGGTVMDGGGGAITNPAVAPDASYGQHGDFIGGQTTQEDRSHMPTASSYNSSQTYGSAPQATGMDMVTMVAPDGTRQQVPRNQAGHYTQMGAKVIGLGRDVMGWFEQNAPQPVAQTPEGQTSGVPLNTTQTPIPQPSSGTDYRATFDQLFPGSSLSPEQLAANEDKLKAAGFRLLGPNAAGQRSKIELPNGQIVDLFQGAGSGKNIKQWSIDSGGGSGGIGEDERRRCTARAVQDNGRSSGTNVEREGRRDTGA